MRLFKKNKTARILVVILSVILMLNACSAKTNQNQESTQTDVQNATVSVNKDGICIMNIKGVGEVMHPAWIGIYALQYAGAESFYDKAVDKSDKKFSNCVNWFKKNAKTTKDGFTVWEYTFDSTYNDVSIKAPWYSAFGQALAIESLVEYYNQHNDEAVLQLAKKGSEVLFASLEKGGLLFQNEEDIWFEEIPSKESPSHILNGNMRALIALQKLYKATNDEKYNEWYEKGITTLEKWLPKYDTGYWLRYDLNPKKDDLLFRFNNKYGYNLNELPIDEIKLTDPLTGESVSIDVGSAEDASEGQPRISGNDWQQVEELDGKTVRRLSSVTPESSSKQLDGEMYAPYTYFYLKLPSEWKNNLRTDWFEMTVTYKDEKAGNMNIQMRSIANGNAFIELKDGDLLLNGSGQWRDWKVPVRTTDLGWWTGELYAQKHLQYLNCLAQYSPKLKQWADVMNGYINSSKVPENTEIVQMDKPELPKQLPMMPVYALDENGVITAPISNEDTELKNGYWLDPSTGGVPAYSPYLIAEQAIIGSERYKNNDLFDIRSIQSTNDYWRKYDWIFPNTIDRIKKQPAFNWLGNNGKTINDGLVWNFGFPSSYNDLVQEVGWQSSFSQRYVIDAFMSIDDKETALKGAYAYEYPTKDGGLSSYAKDGYIWWEEVPNNSHILNAHLASIVALDSVNKKYKDERVEDLYNKGIKSLSDNIYKFDNGYWTKYDMNPKKEMLLQLDWNSGEKSPLIDEVQLYNPVTNMATQIDVGESNDFSSYPSIGGSEWSSPENVDEKTARSFTNGYNLRNEAVQGGTVHNVYINAVLPQREFEDYFDLPTHQLIIKYKDVSKGQFSIKSQAINEGNYLKFIDIPNNTINCIGDNQWKTAVINIRPQDTGWYMGEDYQKYHNEQLGIIADSTGSWLFKQYLEKWQYYLDSYNNKKDVIIDNKKTDMIDISDKMKILNGSETYDGFSLENSLDNDSNDDYTAFSESETEQSFEIGFSEPQNLSELEFTFESDNNYLNGYSITFYNGDDETYSLNIDNKDEVIQKIPLSNVIADRFVVKATKFEGQQRILLRQIKAYSN